MLSCTAESKPILPPIMAPNYFLGDTTSKRGFKIKTRAIPTGMAPSDNAIPLGKEATGPSDSRNLLSNKFKPFELAPYRAFLEDQDSYGAPPVLKRPTYGMKLSNNLIETTTEDSKENGSDC